ncbi:terminase large subunit [Ancylobacter sp. MQZ15Z-1]|uniref:Terminase large subunit n=1 Tax=Ancylobacter mangrovi TaxID=2972472 RepID=A0A9X2T7X0_9HYPH|nr:terminase TerL endonuclease subunit [Ancylobacter mangrovi]MCS0497874.1 terminase large subunit [Ancylobacter mangrovi]
MRHAAERHLRDLKDGPSRGLHWRPEKAAHAIGFYPAMLTITEGTKVGQPFQLLPWHTFVAGSLFGWRKDSGRMRFRSGWLETGKGQAKSPFMAATGLYMSGFCGIHRARAFAIGQDKNTANVLFKDAVAMCRAPIPGGDEDDTLVASGHVVVRGEGDNAWKLEFIESESIFQSLANGEAISGPKPTFVGADEIHEFKNNTSIELWKAAIAKMPGDAFMLLGTNTPSSTQIVGTEYSEFYQKVALGEIDDDEAFAFVARVDKADRETVFDNEDCWPKALPALGVTFPIENIRGQVKTAKSLLSTALSLKRLYFGIPIGATEFWIAEEAWSAVQGRVDADEFRGCPCWLSLDLSQKNDLTALTAVWLKDGKLYAKTWYWTTKDGLEERAKADQAPYDRWALEGHITAVDGAVIDKSFVAAKVAEICASHEARCLAFDPAGIGSFMEACEDIGLPAWLYEGPDTYAGNGLMLVPHGQGTRIVFYKQLDENGKPIERLCMPRSIERLEDQILKKSIVIDHTPVTYACAANAHVIADGMNNRAFDKKRSRGRIDGMVTIAMATGAALAQPVDTAKSFWDVDDFVSDETDRTP